MLDAINVGSARVQEAPVQDAINSRVLSIKKAQQSGGRLHATEVRTRDER